MRLNNKSLLLLELAGTALALPSMVNKRAAAKTPQANHVRAHDVKEAFEISWNGYYKDAFPHDTLHPLSHSYADDR